MNLTLLTVCVVLFMFTLTVSAQDPFAGSWSIIRETRFPEDHRNIQMFREQALFQRLQNLANRIRKVRNHLNGLDR